MNKRRAIAGIALATLIWAAAGAMKVGDVTPDFARSDIQGKQFRLADHRGKLVLLNFWATWCAPCREEMPAFSTWQKDLQAKGLQVVGVSMDDDVSEVKKFLAAHPVSYPIMMGDAQLAEHFGGVLGLPLSYLIDAQGRVIARYQGEADLAKMEAKVRELLSASVGDAQRSSK